MTTVIDRTLAVQLLEQVVAAGGEDFVYGRTPMGKCLYQHEGKPSCGIGQALFLTGLTIETLDSLDQEGIDSSAIQDTTHILREHDLLFTEAGMSIFSFFQLYQDQGTAWGNSLRSSITESEFADDENIL
jgi:hypothetical protein